MNAASDSAFGIWNLAFGILMSLRIYNTLTRNKDVFEPVIPGKVGMYLCGPTVYKSPHIGHMVGPIIFDVVKRYLLFKGYAVTWVVNITDVDDKMIRAAAEQGEPIDVLATRHTAEYMAALRALGIDTIDRFPKATEHMGEIIAMTGKLVETGNAYATPEGNVWFDVTRDADYGKLSGRKLDESAAGTRELEGGSGKRNPADFALWKSAKPGEPAWDSPWGRGRPGWHIECSAMATKYLGDTLDIHGGGDDLKFPHHENELAQSECCTGKPFAKFWLHNGLTTFNTKKISGSDLAQDTDEARKLREMLNFSGLLERLGPELVRYLILSTHYRRPINFGDDVIDSTRKGLSAFHRLFDRATRLGVPMDDAQPDVDVASRTLMEGPTADYVRTLLNLKMKWLEVMDDDFNTAGAIAAMHEIIGATNAFIDGSKLEAQKSDAGVQAVAAGIATIRKLGKILGLFATITPAGTKGGDDLSPKLMELLIHLRKELRTAKNFQLADQLRARLVDVGVTLEDRPGGETIWRKG
jgi:cysteinyl-tRNA synthetase